MLAFVAAATTAALGHKLYGSWVKILQVEVTYCSAVVATQSHCSYRQLLFSSHPIDTENISHVSVTDHTTASRTFSRPIHLVRHGKPRWPEDKRDRTRISSAPIGMRIPASLVGGYKPQG